VFAIFSEILNITLEFQLPMTVATYCSLEIWVQFLCDWVLYFKAEDICFGAVEAASGIAHLLPA
jgi:hypothetical protein